MGQMPNKRKFRVQIISKPAIIRLTILFIALTAFALWIWLSMLSMPGQTYTGALPPLQPDQTALQNALKTDVQKLAVEIGSRNQGSYQKLNAAKTFLETALAASGYDVKPQEYQIDGKPYTNLAVQRLGTAKPNEVVLVGGHYDSAFTSPGANDNGTGAAATLELAKLFANKSTYRTVRFVEFTNEEPPFFQTENMGSLVYAQHIDPRQEKIVAMLSLETMGYFSDVAGSQKYPFPIGLLYPTQGNFIGLIGNLKSGDLVRRAIGSFRRHTQFPSQGVVLPSWVPGVGWSDQWAFWQQGYPGIMVTDTAPYRYPHYHTADDTIDKINFDHLARVVSGLADVIADLAE
jgi:Peptidase family M28